MVNDGNLHHQSIGMYLDRPVELSVIHAASDLACLDLSGSTVLLGVGQSALSPVARNALVRQLLERDPLAVIVHGLGAEELFDEPLQQLSVIVPVRPVMTNFADGELSDALQVFFWATWPSDDNWDRCRSYHLVCIGDDEIDTLKAAALELLKT